MSKLHYQSANENSPDVRVLSLKKSKLNTFQNSWRKNFIHCKPPNVPFCSQL